MDPAKGYQAVAEILASAGGTPLPMTDTLTRIIKLIVDADDIDFILAFKEQKSQTMEQLTQSSGLSEEMINEKVRKLAKKGVIFNQPNSKGVMVFRLLPLVNVGVFEYTFMQKLERSEKNLKLATLFERLFDEAKGDIQAAYEDTVSFMELMPPVDRTVPVTVNKATGNSTLIEINTSIEPVEKILPTQSVAKLIEKFDEIAVGHCFCRHHKDLTGEPCKQTDSRESCFTFGKSARYTSEQQFMRMIDKKEALEILMKAEEDGLVHKAYHPGFDTSRDETSVCNCCKCCCGNSTDNQIWPIVNAAAFAAQVDEDACTGCGTCTENCHSDAVALNGANVSFVDEERCIGCGVCARFCPEDAIRLKEADRIVRIAPPRQN